MNNELSKFSVGNTVLLKSGSPIMTVSDVDDMITCVWYSPEDHIFQIERFEEECLTLWVVDISVIKNRYSI
jgi:uncharacterized protein YodC (DUF2158 family)